MQILQMTYMQIYAEINFIRGYLSLSFRSVCVWGKNLNLMSYFVCCPAIT